MILILSTDGAEPTTINVMKWLYHYKANFRRFNGQDLRKGKILVDFESDRFDLEGGALDLDKVNIIWLRRFDSTRNVGFYFSMEGVKPLAEEMGLFVANESKGLATYFFERLEESKAKFLTPPKNFRVNKLILLKEAQKAGLKIPDTIVTSSKKDLIRFISKHKKAITKPINQTRVFPYGTSEYYYYTTLLTEASLEDLEEDFFPTLVQEAVDKEVEIRTFYLDGKCYSMGIFSQKNEKTKVDFRNYDSEHPNRNVPFKLPEVEEKKIATLMKNIDLNCGSLDILLNKEGEFVFLEVNPVGQFGMVSYPCNYNLEEKVAKWLIDNDKPYEVA